MLKILVILGTMYMVLFSSVEAKSYRKHINRIHKYRKIYNNSKPINKTKIVASTLTKAFPSE
jgi:hypothetical protein